MSRRAKDGLWLLALTASSLFALFTSPARWLMALDMVLLAAYGFATASSYWFRGEVYRVGGIPTGEEDERTDEDDAGVIVLATQRIRDRNLGRAS